MDNAATAYRMAQRAIADLKAAVLRVLDEYDAGDGLTNAEIGRRLGIYGGHARHEGHVSRTLLAKMESDGTVAQDRDTKCWQLRVR